MHSWIHLHSDETTNKNQKKKNPFANCCWQSTGLMCQIMIDKITMDLFVLMLDYDKKLLFASKSNQITMDLFV